MITDRKILTFTMDFNKKVRSIGNWTILFV